MHSADFLFRTTHCAFAAQLRYTSRHIDGKETDSSALKMRAMGQRERRKGQQRRHIIMNRVDKPPLDSALRLTRRPQTETMEQ
jgi:hypothetical protein